MKETISINNPYTKTYIKISAHHFMDLNYVMKKL